MKADRLRRTNKYGTSRFLHTKGIPIRQDPQKNSDMSTRDFRMVALPNGQKANKASIAKATELDILLLLHTAREGFASANNDLVLG